MKTRKLSKFAQIRQAVADYMATEGCSCCGDYEQHAIDKIKLGRILRAQRYSDGSGYSFRPFETKK
jgi:hypothetical protein